MGAVASGVVPSVHDNLTHLSHRVSLIIPHIPMGPSPQRDAAMVVVVIVVLVVSVVVIVVVVVVGFCRSPRTTDNDHDYD